MKNPLKILIIAAGQDCLKPVEGVVADVFPDSRVLTSLDGRQGLDLAITEDPDVVLLDIAMPRLDVFGICRQLKADERLRQIPVIFLTAQDDRENRIKALEAGGDAFLAKPIEKTELTAQIRAMARIKAAAAQERMGESWQKTEAAIAHAKEEWERTFDAIPDLICLLDSRHTILRLNKAMADKFGVHPKEMIGKTCYQCMHGLQSPPDFCPHTKLLQDRQPHQVDMHEPRLGGDFIITCTPLWSKEGQFLGSVHVAHDITERKQAEEKLRASEERHRTILQAAMDGFMAVDTQGQVLETNEAYCRMSGYSEAELLSMNIADLEAIQSADEVASHIQKVKELGELRFEARNRRKDGSIFDVEISAQFQSAGNRFVAFLHDITERKRMAESLDSERQFLAALLDNVGEAIVSCDAQGILARFNRAARKLHGQPEIPIPASQWADYYNLYEVDGRTHLSKEHIPLYRALQGEVVRDAEMMVINKDGSAHYLVANGQPLHNADGDIVGAVAAMHDITDRKQTEMALRTSEASLQSVLQSTADGILAISKENKVLFVSQRFLEMWRIPPAVMASRDDAVLLQCVLDQLTDPQDFLRKVQELYRSRDESFDTLSFKDGRIFERLSRPLLCENVLSGRVWSFRDVTGRKLAESALRASEAKYRRLHESMMDALVIVDMAGHIQEFNSVYQAMLGYSEAELHQMTYQELTPAQWHDQESRIIAEQVLSKGYSEVYEKEYHRRDGTVFPIELRAFLIRNDAGQPSGMWAIVRDISRRKRAETELQQYKEHLEDLVLQRTKELMESQGHFSYLVSSSPVVIYTAKATGDYNATFVSENVFAQLGYESHEFIEDPSFWASRIHPDDVSCVFAGLPELFKNGHLSHEYRFRVKDGSYRWMYDQMRLVRDGDGKPFELIGYWIDISRRKQLEEKAMMAVLAAENANRAKSIFLANMSHELRTPLTAVLGFADLMSRDPIIPVRSRENLAIILRSGEHLLALINDILDLSRIDANRVEIELHDVDLGELVRDVVNMMRVRAEARRLWLVLDQASEFPRFVNTDSGKLRQILVNLVDNAIKFTQAGQVVIRLNANPTPNGHLLEIEVRDTGIGIGRDDLNRIFLPFEQAGNQMTEGIGIGLAITRQYIEMLGGQISVESEPGKGSCFRFTIQVGRACPSCQSRPADPPPSVHRRPLTADDLRVLSPEALATLLRLANDCDDIELAKWLEAQTVLAPAAKEALACLIKDYRFDVIIELAAPLAARSQ